MTTTEIQDYIHLYSMLTFRNGNREPGILINKYNITTTEVEYYFIKQPDMQAYKTAFEKYDKAACQRLSRKIDIAELVSIRPVSLQDYKAIMQLLQERKQILEMKK